MVAGAGRAERHCRAAGAGPSTAESVVDIDSTKGTRESFIRFAVDRETDAKELKLLEQEIRKVLADIRLAVRDWKKMRLKMIAAKDLLEFGPTRADEALRSESQEFLQWLADDHFTFLGYREYKLSHRGKKVFLEGVKDSGLGLLSRQERGDQPVEMSDEMRRLTRSKDWLILTKANSRSTIHRHVYLDYIGIKVYDENGVACGERRFIGLFASAAYSETPRNIPLLRHKMAKIFERGHIEQKGHRGRALSHIINGYPRDELIQASIRTWHARRPASSTCKTGRKLPFSCGAICFDVFSRASSTFHARNTPHSFAARSKLF